MAFDLCLQLAKYSHVDNLETSGKDKWTHLVHHDMFVLLKGNESSGAVVLTIIAGNSKLVSKARTNIVLKPRLTHRKETIDIGTYVDHALSARRSAEQRGLDSIRTDQLPIFCITKDAALALRYRLFDTGVVRHGANILTTAWHAELVERPAGSNSSSRVLQTASNSSRS